MEPLTIKPNNNHHKTSSDFCFKDKLKKNISPSAELFKPNSISIKINKISNSKEDTVFTMNQKVANGRSFDKKMQEKKGALKIYIKDKKEKNENNYNNNNSEKYSYELESRDEISTNNLTEILFSNSNVNNKEYKYSDLNNLNININGINFITNPNVSLSKSVFNNSMNNNKKFIGNLNIKNIININSIHKKKEQNENKAKNISELKFLKVNTKNKKCLNNINTIKKSLNLNLNNKNDNKKINVTKRKFSNVRGENHFNMGINGTIPLKSKTQNYINLNIRNFYSNKKLMGNSKIFTEKFNNSYENNKINNNLLSSKKKLFIKNRENNNILKRTQVNQDINNNKQTKKTVIINNINLKKKNDLLKNIFSTKKILRTTSPRSKNINKINFKKSKNSINKNVNQTTDNNLTITQEKVHVEEICYTERIENIIEQKLLDGIKVTNDKDSKNLNSIMKKNLFLSQQIGNNSTNNNYKNITKNSNQKSNQINLNKDDLIISKKKKNSDNAINNAGGRNKKQLNLEKNYPEKTNNKYIKKNIPLINKVHVFEIGNSKISKNNNLNNSNNDINNKKNNNTLLNLIFDNSEQKKGKENPKANENISELTPEKKKLTDIIDNNMKYKNNNFRKNINSINLYPTENNSTPLEQVLDSNKSSQKRKDNVNDSSTNINKNNNSNTEHKYINMKNGRNKFYKKDKEFCEMETPTLLNTGKITQRMFDIKLNLFEKIKNTNNDLDKSKKNINDTSSENSEIIYQEIYLSSNNNKKNNLKKSIRYIIFLDRKCLEQIIDFLDIKIINILCTVNKRCFNTFKTIVNKKIKNKILLYYSSTNIIYLNKIKLSLMNFTPLSKLSPLLLHKKYVDLLLENNQKYDQEIKKDLTRTFPDNSSFKKGNNNYNKLYHLLTVYSLYNEKIGYTQGINFILADIILLMEKEKEEKCLMLLDGLLQKFDFEKLLGFGIGDLLKKNLNLLGKYLEKYCPEIPKFLENWNLSHEIFSTNWMLTLLANSIESKYLFIVWDFIIIFGWKFFMCFIVSVLNLFKTEILNEQQNNLTFFMKNILKNQKFKEKFNFIVNKTIDLMNKNYKFSDK